MPELFGDVDDRNSPQHLCRLAGVAVSNRVGVPGVVLVLQGEPCFPSWPKREAIEESLICEDCLCGILIQPCWHRSPVHCGQGSDEGADWLLNVAMNIVYILVPPLGRSTWECSICPLAKAPKTFSYQVGKVTNAEVLLVQFAPVRISQTQEMILEQMFRYFYCLAQRVVVQQACH